MKRMRNNREGDRSVKKACNVEERRQEKERRTNKEEKGMKEEGRGRGAQRRVEEAWKLGELEEGGEVVGLIR